MLCEQQTIVFYDSIFCGFNESGKWHYGAGLFQNGCLLELLKFKMGDFLSAIPAMGNWLRLCYIQYRYIIFYVSDCCRYLESLILTN